MSSPRGLCSVAMSLYSLAAHSLALLLYWLFVTNNTATKLQESLGLLPKERKDNLREIHTLGWKCVPGRPWQQLSLLPYLLGQAWGGVS